MSRAPQIPNGYRYNVGLAFAEIAAAAGERAALVMQGAAAATFQDLNRSANRMAAVFADRGLGRRDVLAIVHTKTPACYAAMLAALKLGAAYVNLDEQNPPARLKHIFGSARPKLVFSEAAFDAVVAVAGESGAAVVSAEQPAFAMDLASAHADEPRATAAVTGAEPAYIMYTSGSTGVPKGAAMTHANVLNFGQWAGERFAIGERDVLTNLNPMYFDNSVFDFYGALLNGAALAPFDRETVSDPAAMLAAVERARCSVWFSVPSLLIYLATLKLLTPERLPSIRTFAFGGEGYPKPELRKLFATYGARSRLVNVYGPTECTCICSAWDVREEDLADDTGLVTLGPVAENFTMLVLEGERAVSPGETGELCLLGPQVGLGYFNDPLRTAAAFVANPLNDSWTERMYRTGDLVKLGADGRTLDFVGRKDNQIKHMGYRIELEEIEAAIARIDGVVQTAVLQKATLRGFKAIIAYVAVDRPLSEDELRCALRELLPPYMLPQRFEVRASLPKNANGKVDRVALAAE